MLQIGFQQKVEYVRVIPYHHINDLASEVKQLDIGIDIENGKICILLFVDDIVILAEDEIKLQILLDFTNEWCKKWRLKIDNDKTKLIHNNKCNISTW